MNITIQRDFFSPMYKVAEYFVRVDSIYAGKIVTRRGHWFYSLVEGGSGYETTFRKAEKVVREQLAKLA